MKKIFLVVCICVLFVACGKKELKQIEENKTKVDEIVSEIASSPLTASNPGAYIDEHKEKYDELVDMGIDALKVIFYDFGKKAEDAGATLEDHIKILAAQEILGDENVIEESSSPYAWYKEFKRFVISASEQNDKETMKVNLPKSYALLDILKK
ncbi:MAG: hypothetical protein IJS47_00805 [Clostridia bacterium]|nr:hypothetical protein [Clostridia bacterium]